MNKSNLLHYVSKACERPLLIMPEKLAVIAGVLEGRIGVDASDLQHLVDEKMLAYVNKPAPDANSFAGEKVPADASKPYGKQKPYRMAGNTAIIPVQGSLVNRGAWLGSYSGMTSYEGIRHQLATAATDADVANVILDVDSPGGEAIGAFEAGADVGALNAVKPVTAYVNGLCCSAAYAIASHAGKIVASPTSVVGSIGVVMMHVDQSERMRAMGVKPTFIFAGAHKVDANPFEPLSETVKADLQAEVDKLYGLFVDHVAAGRKGLSAKAIRATEAGTFMGSDAVDAKLADAIGTFESTLTGLQRRSKTAKRTKMELEHEAAPAVEAEVEAPVAAAEAPAAAPVVEAAPAADVSASLDAVRAEGAAAERARINAIISLPEAQGREASAMHLAMSTSMSAEQVKPVLAGLPAVGAKSHAANGLGLVVSSPVAAPAASGWDRAMKRAGASLPEKKSV